MPHYWMMYSGIAKLLFSIAAAGGLGFVVGWIIGKAEKKK